MKESKLTLKPFQKSGLRKQIKPTLLNFSVQNSCGANSGRNTDFLPAKSRIHFLLFFLLFTNLKAELVDEGWKAWIRNDHETAKQKFTEAISENPDRALSSLILIEEQENNLNSAWLNFDKLVSSPKNYTYFNASVVNSFFNGNTISSKKTDKLFDRIIKNPDRQGFSYVIAMEQKGDRLLAKGNYKKANEKFYNQLGFVKDWVLVGPFDNVSNSGYNEIFPPETENDFSKTYDGLNKIPVKWFVPSKFPHSPWINLNFNFFGTAITSYATTFVFSPIEQKVDFRLGTSGSFKLWLNDKEILAEEKELDNGIDTFDSHTKLYSGWNKILLKICKEESPNFNFALRICDSKGKKIEGLNFSTELQNYTKADSNFQAETFLDPTEAFFRNKIQANPNHLENYFYLANYYNYQDRGDKTELILRELLKQFPDFGFANQKMAEANHREGKNDDHKSLMDKVFKLDKKSFTALFLKFSEFAQNENVLKAEETGKLIFELNSENYQAFDVKASLLSLKRDFQAREKLIYDCWKVLPNNYNVLQSVVLLDLRKKKDFKSATKKIKNFLRNQKSFEAYNLLAQVYTEKGDLKNTRKTYEKMLELFPNFTGPVHNLAKLKFNLSKFEECVELCERGISLAPTVVEFHTLKGDSEKILGNKRKAVESFQNALKIEKGNYVTRDKLRELLEKTPISRLIPQVDLKAKMILSPSAKDYPEDSGVILVDDNFRVVYKDGASESYNQLFVKVFNSSGADDWQRYYIEYNPFNEKLIVEEAKILKSDGREIIADQDQDEIVFKGIEAGDFVYLKWRVINYFSGSLSEHFWDRQYFQSFYPSASSRYGLLIPEDFEFNVKLHNVEIEPEISILDDKLQLYIWELTDQPSMKFEPAMPDINDAGKWIFVSSISDWNEIANWYYKLARGKVKSSIEIQEKVKELTKGLETNEEKVKAIYTYIVENIRYSSISFRQSGLIPQKARDTLINKIGDCKDTAALMVSMLNEVEIPSYQVLVNTRNEGTVSVLPSPEFNHCIVAVEQKDSSLVYLDLTAANMPFGTLPISDQKANSLLINGQNSDLQNLPEMDQKEENIVIRKVEAKIEKNGNLYKKSNSTKKGLTAFLMRNGYRNYGQKEQKDFLSQTIASNFANSELVELEFKNIDEFNEPFEYFYSFKAEKYAVKVENLMIFKMPWTDALKPLQALGDKERKYDYETWVSSYDNSSVEEFVLEIPKNFAPKKMNEDFELDTKLGTYKLRLRYEKSKIYGKREFHNKTLHVRKEDFEVYKNFINTVIEKDTKLFVLWEKKANN